MGEGFVDACLGQRRWAIGFSGNPISLALVRPAFALPTVLAWAVMSWPRRRSARSPAPPGAILEEFFHIFSGVRRRCGWPLPVAVGVYRARVARIRSPRRGGHRGGGLHGHAGLLDRQLGAALQAAARTSRVYVASLSPGRGRSLRPPSVRLPRLLAKGGVDDRLVCLRRHLRLDPLDRSRPHAELCGDLQDAPCPPSPGPS